MTFHPYPSLTLPVLAIIAPSPPQLSFFHKGSPLSNQVLIISLSHAFFFMAYKTKRSFQSKRLERQKQNKNTYLISSVTLLNYLGHCYPLNRKEVSGTTYICAVS